MNKIIIYTNETCPYCKLVKKELTENNIDFENRLTKDWVEEWQSIVDLTGMVNLPTIDFNSEMLTPGRDFSSPKLLVNLINNYRPSKYTINERILDKVKTLNYTIYTAFTNTNKILTEIETKINKNEH